MSSATFGITPRTYRGRKLARVRVGAISDLTEGDWPDVRSYADRIDHYVLSLNHDAKSQIVFDDPFVVSEMLKKAKAGGDIGELTVPILEAYLAAAMAKVKERGGEEQAKRDLQWAARWSPFLAEWNAWHESVNSVSPGIPASQAWAKQQTFEMRLRELESAFLALGKTHVTDPLPATLETSTGKPDAAAGGIPWKPILAVAGAGIGVFGLSALAHLLRG